MSNHELLGSSVMDRRSFNRLLVIVPTAAVAGVIGYQLGRHGERGGCLVESFEPVATTEELPLVANEQVRWISGSQGYQEMEDPATRFQFWNGKIWTSARYPRPSQLLVGDNVDLNTAIEIFPNNIKLSTDGKLFLFYGRLIPSSHPGLEIPNTPQIQSARSLPFLAIRPQVVGEGMKFILLELGYSHGFSPETNHLYSIPYSPSDLGIIFVLNRYFFVGQEGFELANGYSRDFDLFSLIRHKDSILDQYTDPDELIINIINQGISAITLNSYVAVDVITRMSGVSKQGEFRRETRRLVVFGDADPVAKSKPIVITTEDLLPFDIDPTNREGIEAVDAGFEGYVGPTTYGQWGTYLLIGLRRMPPGTKLPGSVTTLVLYDTVQGRPIKVPLDAPIKKVWLDSRGLVVEPTGRNMKQIIYDNSYLSRLLD